MTNYYDSDITQILPGALARTPEAQAIGYAVNRAIRRTVDYAHTASVYAAIDELPEKILDLLAAELRSQYYDSGMGISEKRKIVKKTLLWYSRAGTPSAVQELIETIFGEGRVKEWFDYGGNPYNFKIETNAILTEDINARFTIIIKKVKNARSHLEAIEIRRTVSQGLYSGAAMHSTYRPAAIIDGYSEFRQTILNQYSGASVHSNIKPAAIIDGYSEKRTNTVKQYIALPGNTKIKPAAIIDGFSTDASVSGEIYAGTAQNSHIKSAAITEGCEYKAEPVTQELIAGSGINSTYKNQAIHE